MCLLGSYDGARRAALTALALSPAPFSRAQSNPATQPAQKSSRAKPAAQVAHRSTGIGKGTTGTAPRAVVIYLFTQKNLDGLNNDPNSVSVSAGQSVGVFQ